MKLERVKTHFRDNKGRYLAGLGIVGAVGGAYYLGAQRATGDTQVKLIGSPLSRVNVANVYFEERSTPSKPVHLVGSNRYFSSIGEAARETGHRRDKISKQLNGHLSDLNGDVFEIIDLGD